MPLLIAAGSWALAGEPDELTLFDRAGRPSLYEHLVGEASRQFALRRSDVAKAFQSREALLERRQRLQSALLKMLGEMPARTPLAARTVGTIDCDGYRIERVTFKSRPRHHITANLYLPASATRGVPGVRVPCGHSANGKASEAYQSVCVLLALNGCAALIYDPIGQGVPGGP